MALLLAGYAAESLLGNSRFRFLSTKLTRRCAGAVNRLPRSRRTSGSYSPGVQGSAESLKSAVVVDGEECLRMCAQLFLERSKVKSIVKDE